MIFIDHTSVLEGQVAVIEVTGPLDSDSSTEFEEYANRILDGTTRYIILNMEKIDYVSSAGIGLILYLQKTIIRLGGYFVIFNLNEETGALFNLLGFDKVLSMAGTRIEAMEIIDRQMELRENEIVTGEDKPETEGEHTRIEAVDEVPASQELPEENDSLQAEETPPQSAEENIQFDPFIIECNHCESLIRIKQPGNYLCPDCNASFSVDNEMTVTYT